MKAGVDSASPERRTASDWPAKSLIAIALIGSLLMTAQRPALAEDGPTTATRSEQQRALAEAKYQQGVAAYLSEHYADAVRFFLEADALSPSPALSFNIARADEKLADDAATLRWYRSYMRLDPQGPKATEVQESIKRLADALAQKGIQQITVLSTPAGATVGIDDQALGVTPLTVELRPGTHHLLLTLRGFADAAHSFTLEASSPMDLSFELQAAPKALPVGVVGANPPAPPKDAGRRFGVVPWIVLGAGAAALGTAAVFEVRRRSAQNAAIADSTQLATQQDLDARDSRQTMARVFLGVGGVLAVTGSLLLVFEPPNTPQSRAVISSRPGGATLSWERSF